MSTHYDLLGVAPDAHPDDIKRAYRVFSRRHHPDVAGPEHADTFARGAAAYATLSDPAQREAYDLSLAHPQPAQPAPDEPLDSWADTPDTGWDDEPLDDVVVEEPATPPAPATPPSTPPSPATATPRVTDAVAPPALIILVGLAAGTLTSLAAPLAPLTALIVTVAGFAACGAASVYALLKSPARSASAPGPLTRSAVLALLAIIATPAIALGALSQQSSNSSNLLWALAPALTGIITAVIAVPTIRLLRANAKIVKTKTLLTHEVFGTTPPGYAPALLNQHLIRHLHEHPTARLVQHHDPTMFFSHALVDGDHIVLLRALGAPSGTYQWSGASLLFTDGATFQSALEGDYAAAVRRLTKKLTKKGTVTTAIVVIPQPHDHGDVTVIPTGSGHPQILTATQLASLLTSATQPGSAPTVRRDVFCDAVRALHTQKA